MTYLSQLLHDQWTKACLGRNRNKNTVGQSPNRVRFQKFFGFLNLLA